MKIILLAVFLLSAFISKAQNTLNIVPMPAEMMMGKGHCVLFDKFSNSAII